MDVSNLQSRMARRSRKRVGRGGKRGTFSGKGTKGQKSRAGAGFKPGFRGGDNRIWQLFPKSRGASKKPGSSRIHVKHRLYQLRADKLPIFNLDFFSDFSPEELITPKLLYEKGLLPSAKNGAKVLGNGEVKNKLSFEGFKFSKSARDKVIKAGGSVK